jgi:DNA-binding transcriptional ArsR family regulator
MPVSADKRRSGPFGHPTRVRIYRHIHQRGDATPGEMARELDLNVGTVSHHVKALVDDKVLEMARTFNGSGRAAAPLHDRHPRAEPERCGRQPRARRR